MLNVVGVCAAYRLPQILELLLEAVDLLVLVGQQHEQVVLLLLGLLQLPLQLGLLRLQDGHRAGGRGQLLLHPCPALRQALDLRLGEGGRGRERERERAKIRRREGRKKEGERDSVRKGSGQQGGSRNRITIC